MEKDLYIEEHIEEIEQLEKDLIKLTEYDWSYRRLYDEDKVDFYATAINLLKAGYRKGE